MSRLRVIVAEDEEDIREYFRELLTYLGHEVSAVADGPSLVRACRASAPDVVVADWGLGEPDGLAAEEEVNREQPVPFILVTGGDLTALPDLTGRNVVAVLSKPIREADLKEAIERAAAAASRADAF